MKRFLIAVCLLALPALAADLADAAEQSNWHQLRRLLASHASVNLAQPDGMTALHWAVRANQEDMVALLLQSGADPNSANRYAITPLWLAATNGSAPVVRRLLKAGANAKATMPHGETALMAAARTGEAETIRLLLQAGADPNAKESSQGETGLMWAAAENHPEAIRLLIAGGADPNLHARELNLAPMDWMQVGMVSTVLPHGGFTALMYAARQDARDAARALAENHADLDAQDADGTTALEFAIINQHYDLAAVLLQEGANPNVGDNTGMTAVYALIDMNGFQSEIGRPARVLPDQLRAMDVLKLALQRGGDPNAPLRKRVLARHHGFPDAALDQGATPLMRAARSNDVAAMKALLEAGADAKLTMANGGTVLTILAGTRPGTGANSAENLVSSLHLLVEHGAQVNAATASGDTPLHAAARAGSNAMVRALVELGANLEAKDKSGKTALELVREPGRNRHEDTEAVLRELAAKPR